MGGKATDEIVAGSEGAMQSEAPVSQPEPQNLEEALKALRDHGEQAAQNAVGGSGVRESADGSGEIAGGNAGEHTEAQEETDNGVVEEAVLSEQGGAAGGSAAVAEELAQGDVNLGFSAADYHDIQKNMLESVRRQAAMATNQKFREEGINKITLSQLYQRDENSGRVSFVNPDDPDRPFNSRAEAQAWVDSYNSQIEAEWVNYANQMQQRFANDTLPAMRLLQFAPTYDAMDANTQKVFDTIIEPYSVKDSTGALIGFSCDLNAAAAQAEKLTDIFGTSAANGAQPQAAQAPSAPAPSGPALDAPTSGTGTSKGTNAPEPKNLNEAMKILNQQNKKEKK